MPINRFKTDEGFTILRVEDKLVASTLATLKNSLDLVIAKTNHKVAINLEKVNAMDSIVAGFLVSRYKTSSKKNGTLALCGLSPAMKKLLSESCEEIADIVYETEEEALTAIAEKEEKNNG